MARACLDLQAIICVVSGKLSNLSASPFLICRVEALSAMCTRYTQLKTRIEKAKQRTLPIAYHHLPWGVSFAQPVFLSFHVKWRILLSICYQVSKCGFPTSTTHTHKKKAGIHQAQFQVTIVLKKVRLEPKMETSTLSLHF